jgi:excisionase family DNA binding protein
MPVKFDGGLIVYNLAELETRLGVTPATLRKYIHEGSLKAEKAGGTWWVTEDALRDYFQGQGRQGAPTP